MDLSAAMNVIINDLQNDIIISNNSCDICKKNVLNNQKVNAYHCNKCDKWTHNKCDDTISSTEKYSKELCLKCSISFNFYNIPFTLCNNDELSNVYSCNSLKFLNALPSFEILSEVSKFSDLQLNEVDLNLAYQADCTYYKVGDLQRINLKKNLNIFHTNIN